MSHSRFGTAQNIVLLTQSDSISDNVSRHRPAVQIQSFASLHLNFPTNQTRSGIACRQLQSESIRHLKNLSVKSQAQSHGDITSMEYESVYSYRLIPRHTDVINEVLFVTDRAQCSEEPTVPIEALADVTCCRIVFVEGRLLKDIRNALDRSRPMPVVIAGWLQAVQTVSSVSLQIEFHVKVWISILGIYPPAFLRYFDHSVLTFGNCLPIRLAGALAAYETFRGISRFVLGVDVCREDAGHFAGIFGCELEGVSGDRIERSPCFVRTLRQKLSTSV